MPLHNCVPAIYAVLLHMGTCMSRSQVQMVANI